MNLKKQNQNFSFYKNKKVLITGGDGFIGSHLTPRLVELDAEVTVVGRKKIPNNLRNKPNLQYLSLDLLKQSQCKKAVKDIDFVFHLAGIAGGIGYSSRHQSTLFTKNSLLCFNMLNAIINSSIQRFQFVSSVAVYPYKDRGILSESLGVVGKPEKKSLGYGWAKRYGELLCKLVADEFGMKISIIRPDNTYGEKDNFDPSQARVIPALIQKVNESNDQVEVWGSGNQKRSFVYVKDVIQGILLGLKEYPYPEPINISSNEPTSIKKLVELIVKLSKKRIKIKFNQNKPEGSKIRILDIKKARDLLGYAPKWSLKDGLTSTIKWYKQNI